MESPNRTNSGLLEGMERVLFIAAERADTMEQLLITDSLWKWDVTNYSFEGRVRQHSREQEILSGAAPLGPGVS